MNRYGKRCVLYPRVSTEMQVDGYSLEGQKTMLTRFADREEMVIVDTYEDAGKSGKSIEGRPAFQKMLRDIEEGLDIDYVLVYKLSRFGRNAADILNSLELIQSYGVNLICIEEGIDSSQTSGKLLISVLSAVAEIERENIIEQTMNGRREKARQGGWNGGFAPYGYALVDNKLVIAEAEAVAIRRIFELYTSSEIGLGGVANQLNLEGIRKIPRQNGTLEDWTGHFIKLILDNPVYYGKIAYGRRTKEKVKGTKNDYQMKRNDDYILTDGQHEGIVSEEVWEKAHAKRLRTGVKQPSKIGRDRVHLLSGLLKCPVCGSPMYTNKHAWTNKDGTYKEVYYYVCSRNRMVRGKHCEYKAMLKKNDIEPMVIEAIREIVRNKEYAQAIKKRIGVQIDTKAVDKELEGYRAKLKEVDLNKSRLEREIDNLPIDTKYRERKLHDMALRLDSLYDIIVELEEKIEDAMMRRDAIAQQAITLEGIYKIMVNFDCVYNIISDEEKRAVVTALIKEIELYRNDESECPLKRIGLNFPVFKDGKEVSELLWDKGNTVETVVFYRFQKIRPALVVGIGHDESFSLVEESFCGAALFHAACEEDEGAFFCFLHGQAAVFRTFQVGVPQKDHLAVSPLQEFSRICFQKVLDGSDGFRFQPSGVLEHPFCGACEYRIGSHGNVRQAVSQHADELQAAAVFGQRQDHLMAFRSQPADAFSQEQAESVRVFFRTGVGAVDDGQLPAAPGNQVHGVGQGAALVVAGIKQAASLPGDLKPDASYTVAGSAVGDREAAGEGTGLVSGAVRFLQHDDPVVGDPRQVQGGGGGHQPPVKALAAQLFKGPAVVFVAVA